MGKHGIITAVACGLSLLWCGCATKTEDAAPDLSTSDAGTASAGDGATNTTRPPQGDDASSTDPAGDDGSATTSTSSGSTGPGSGSADEASDTGPAPNVVDDEWISRFEGQWVGQVLDGPNGDHPKVTLSYAWNEDGSMETNIVLPNGSTMDFRFLEVDGVWEMREGVMVLKGGAHSNRQMTQLWRKGDQVRWVWNDEEPEDARVDITITSDTQLWDVNTRSCGHAPGERHALIDLVRP